MEKQWFHCSRFLLLIFVPTTLLGQALSPTPLPITEAHASGAHGAYLFSYRTPAHVRTSSSRAFHDISGAISEFLAAQQVDIRRVEEADAKELSVEKLN